MTSNHDTAARALAATLSNSATDRASAEALLAHLVTQHDHPTHLLRLSAAQDPLVAPAAALRLKNLVRSSRLNQVLSDESRTGVRDGMLHALSVVRGTNVESVLAETTRWLILLDFPSRWPTLLPNISEFLSSGDSSRVHAALITMRQLAKCYEFRSRDPSKLSTTDPNDAGLAHPREPLETLATASFPTLHALYIHLDQIIAKEPYSNPDTRKASLAQRLVVKIFWSCTQFILPPYLAEQGVLDQWITCFFQTLRRPSKHPFIDNPDDLAEEPEAKTKKWIAQVLTRFLKRYGSPKKLPIDEPWSKTVAEAFRDRYADNATTVMLEVLSSPTKGHQVSRRVANISLDFIEEAIETASLWAVIRPHVDTLLTRIVFPYLCFNEYDEEIWLNDPSEYVRKQYDFTEDFTSPKNAAINLLSKMADLRSKSTVLPFLQYLLQTVLDPFIAAPMGSQQKLSLARQKVGAFASIAAVKTKLMSKPELSESFLQVLKTHVEPDLRSEYGFLRSEAAWLLGQVASCEWQEFSVHLGEASLRGCVGLLQDNDVSVQAAAAGALQYLMEHVGRKDLISAVAPQLLERLLQLMESLSDGYLSFLPALDKLVVGYPDEIMPLALPLVQQLNRAFQQAAHSILADTDEEDDDLAFTAAQVLHLISSVISSVGEWQKPTKEDKKTLFASVEKELMPLLESTFQESHQVFVEELLDVLGCLVAQTGALNERLSPFLLSLVPKMMDGLNNWAVEYVGSMMEPIEAYISFGLRDILAMEGGNVAFIRIIQKLWSDKLDESDAIYGVKIAESLALYLQRQTGIPDQVRQQIIVELARSAAAKCVATPEDQTVLRERTFAILMLCIYVDAISVLQGLGAQSVMQLIASQTVDMTQFDRVYSKKSIVLGVGSLLCTKGLVAEESKPHLLSLALKSQHLIDDQRAATAHSALQSSVFAAEPKDGGNGFANFTALPPNDENGSDLEDDQDAVNFLEDVGDHESESLEQLAAESGLSVATLKELTDSNGTLLGNGLFDVDDIDNEDDDEGGFSSSLLDDVDEVEHTVQCVKKSAVDAWWSNVDERDRMAMERLAKRVDR